MARAKKVHVLLFNDGDDVSVLGVFKKHLSSKKLAELELAQGLDQLRKLMTHLIKTICHGILRIFIEEAV